ncbi:MAG TPA: hypothetical protein VFV90_00060 [Usitatibacter sp.]|nr:hypothetical protein [Usitatibacter sp.]
MWGPLLVLAASAFAKYKNDQAAVDRQRAFANALAAFQKQRAGESMAATEQLVNKQTPQAREAELTDLTAQRQQSLRDTVGAAQAFDQPAVAGKTGADFKQAQEQAAKTVSERTKRAIEQLAAISAPGEQQRAFSTRLGRAAGVVDASNFANADVGRAYGVDINNVRPNPFIDLASQVGMAYGGYQLGGGLGAGASFANNGQGYTDAADNLYSGNTTRQARLNRGFSLWGRS